MDFDTFLKYRTTIYSRNDLGTYKGALDVVGRTQPIAIQSMRYKYFFPPSAIGVVLTAHEDESYFVFYYIK